MIDVLTAAEMAVAEIRKHNLFVSSIELTPGSEGSRKHNWRTGEMTRPCLPQVSMRMFSRPEAFLAWCEHLDVERIRVTRRAFDTCLHADTDLYGLCWAVHSSMSRPKSGPHLPGIKPTWWRQPSGRASDDGWITLPDLRVTFAALGVVEVADV